MTKFFIYFNTLKYIKFKQIYYRIYYILRNYLQKTFKIRLKLLYPNKKGTIVLSESIQSIESYKNKNTFDFLNLTKDFTTKIDWNYIDYGRLWTYNLNYFDYLLQPVFDKKEGLYLIHDFIACKYDIRTGYEPYPISLRTINWIKFCACNNVQDDMIDASLYAQFKILTKNLEYHLLGNHLLENAFSLLFGAYYFRDKQLYKKAYKLLKKELNEQILNDGGHFELSPMYHQILLYRLLDGINLVYNNEWIEDDLFRFMSHKAGLMLSWLQNITLPSGNIPHLNDSTNGIVSHSEELFDYAKRLNIEYQMHPLSDSYYRTFMGNNFKCIMDIGGIMPKYQPGHAHADTFNFILEKNGKPVFVDTACSTYEPDAVRNYERGTTAHNTVVFSGMNSSQIWASHRVGKRANVNIINDFCNQIVAQHDGYKELGITHQRSFYQTGDSTIKIVDEILGNSNLQGVAYFHLDREVSDIRGDSNIISLPMCKLVLDGFEEIALKPYEQAVGFNQRIESKCICVTFREKLTTTIQL